MSYRRLDPDVMTELLAARHRAYQHLQRVLSRPTFSGRARVRSEANNIGEFCTQLRRELSRHLLPSAPATQIKAEARMMVLPQYWLAPDVPVIPWNNIPEGGLLPEDFLTSMGRLTTQLSEVNAQASDVVTQLCALSEVING